MKTLITTTIVTAGLFLATAPSASADMYGASNCQPMYGGGQTCPMENKLVLDKKVLNPQGSSNTKGGLKAEEFVDNLGINDPKYKADQTIKFQLNITNTGTEAVSNILVEDTLPDNVVFVSGDGKFDAGSKLYTQTIDKLEANETKTIVITAKTVKDASLPQDQGIICPVNHAQASATDNFTDDTAQFCIERKVLITKVTPNITVYPAPKAKATPKTGPEMLTLFALIPSGLGGLILRRRSKIN